MRALVAAVSVACLCVAMGVRAQVNTRPIVGIMTLPCDDPSMCGSAAEYFPASYVKSLEAGGARVVPIHYTQPKAALLDLLSHLNGVLFTGGGASLDPDSPYFQAIQNTFDFVVQTNTNGQVLPLW
jgi:gamma-glutamyl hydrolase